MRVRKTPASPPPTSATPSSSSSSSRVADPAAPSPGPRGTPRVVDDGFERGAADAPALPSAPGRGPTGAALQIAAAADPFALRVEMLRARLALGVAALPDEAEGGAVAALDRSLTRVTGALDEGRIDRAEATVVIAQLEDMTTSLTALAQGTAKVVVDTATSESSDLRGYTVTTTTGDTLRVAVRARGDEHGEARVKLEMTADDGVAVARKDRVMVRFDLARDRTGAAPAAATIDVEIGTPKSAPDRESLNKRVHGVLFDADGAVVLNRLGNAVPDHHFDVLPDTLDDPERFAAFATAFLATLTGEAAR